MSTRPRKGDTRQRIQDVALELFAEQGYEKTSLREIADRLEVTKAALYYHFKTKEDILISLVEDVGKPVGELIEWGTGQPRTLETKQEILRRYGDAMAEAAPLFRFFQENQATVRDLSIGEVFKERILALMGLLVDQDAPLADRVRSSLAVLGMHAGMFVLQDADATDEEKREAVREVAFDLITRAARGPAE